MGKSKVLSIGSISEGTLKTRDIMQALVDRLDSLALSRGHRKVVREQQEMLETADEDSPYWDDACDDNEILISILEDYAPIFTYVGAHEGDGAALGVWPDWSAITDAERDGTLDKGAVLPNAVEARNHGLTHYLVTNDHGNVILYHAKHAGNAWRWVEEWSIV